MREADYLEFESDYSFKIFHELMARKVYDVLLVSSLYDACILEEDGRLAERIINEYRGLNLSKPPRLTWVSSTSEALSTLSSKDFDLVITMPRLSDIDPYSIGREIREQFPDVPIILLTHRSILSSGQPDGTAGTCVDRTYIWTGNSDLILAQIKSVEDGMNVAHDTKAAGVRVILFVEDSPFYLSSILPILYREVVSQTQAAMEEGLNEEHRLLTMRARAKILVAQNYEDALDLFEKYRSFILGVISDVRFPKDGKVDRNAGITLLTRMKEEMPDLPLLLTSSEAHNREKADSIPAAFIDKNSDTLHSEIHNFFLHWLGFGDFVFRMPDGEILARVSSMRALEKILPSIPEESFLYHGERNDFSRWLFARAEIHLAKQFRPVTTDSFKGDLTKMRDYVIKGLRARRGARQRGIVANFDPELFDPDTDFLKIGNGSLGGKARGLAFMSTLLRKKPELHRKYPDLDITVPQTLVITTEGFDHFIEENDLKHLSKSDHSNEEIARCFVEARFPEWIVHSLRSYLNQVQHPLAVRSSGLMEDAQFRAYAGLYSTYMLPNDCTDLDTRLSELITAIKLVYASTYFQGPKAFGRRVGQRTEEEKMAVVIQKLIGARHGRHFYPAISGVAQSHNYYPFDRMKPEDGCATIALGLGKTVVDGSAALRFSPKHPQILPQFSQIDDILSNAQTHFYALRMEDDICELGPKDDSTLDRREVNDAESEVPVKLLTSTYVPDEHRLRDSSMAVGPRIVTFASVLKYQDFPLPGLLYDVLQAGHEGMGAPVEIEFSVNLCAGEGCYPEFAVLQIRPMTARAELMTVEVTETDIEQSFCYSTNALGNADRSDLADIVFVKPDTFDPAKTTEIAQEISRINASLVKKNRPYLLIGPGRWGSADRWLGIPVTWPDISGVGAVVETYSTALRAEPSQGSHFFHNVTTLGINYLTVSDNHRDFIKWERLTSIQPEDQTRYVSHLVLKHPVTLKVDGRKSQGIIYFENGAPLRNPS